MLAKPRIIISPKLDSWSTYASKEIESSIRSVIDDKGVCSVMLTGGQTAKRLYAYWSKISSLPWDKIRFFFGDERCVSMDHSESNYALAMSSLFPKGIPSGCVVTRIAAEKTDKISASVQYGKLLPEIIDVLLLGLGNDGHIASLFPHDDALKNSLRNVVHVDGPNKGIDRLTITPAVIASAKNIFLLAVGEKKGRVLRDALKSPTDFMSLPVCLTMNGTWLLDSDAAKQIASRSSNLNIL